MALIKIEENDHGMIGMGSSSVGPNDVRQVDENEDIIETEESDMMGQLECEFDDFWAEFKPQSDTD
eukprot:5584002-Amphidinium_carterae.1